MARMLVLERLVAELVLVDVEDVDERLGGEQGQLAQRLEVEPRGEEGRAGSRTFCASSAAARTTARSFLIRASFSSRGIAFSRVCRSARISSVLMVSMSSAGSMRPSTWTTSWSLNARMTWQIASDSRMLARNLLPRPWPSEAPLTMPAMSTKDDGRRQELLRAEDLREHVQPRVGHAHHADVGLDRRERVVRREHVVLGQRVEQGGLADVGQADDPDGEAHGRASLGGSHRTPLRGPSQPETDRATSKPRQNRARSALSRSRRPGHKLFILRNGCRIVLKQSDQPAGQGART